MPSSALGFSYHCMLQGEHSKSRKLNMESEAFKEEHIHDSKVAPGSCFEDLYNYKFQDNIKFVEGWRKVKGVIGKEELYESLVKAQVYFYSREVGPVDLDGYKNWLKENDKEILEFDALVLVEERNEENRKYVFDTKSVDSENEELLPQKDIAGRHPANFIELIEMIQSGLKLPDTENLNIKPLDEDPTPCGLQRPKKPWEAS